MFDILFLGVVWEGMVVIRDKVVEVVGSTGVLLEWSMDRRDCSEEGDGDSLYVVLRASAITFFFPSMCSMVKSS